MLNDHYEQLYCFIESAIKVVMKEQTATEGGFLDSVDEKILQDAQDESTITCPICGFVNGKRKLKCEGCGEKEGLKRAKDI